MKEKSVKQSLWYGVSGPRRKTRVRGIRGLVEKERVQRIMSCRGRSLWLGGDTQLLGMVGRVFAAGKQDMCEDYQGEQGCKAGN